jgi:hypothetical protein
LRNVFLSNVDDCEVHESGWFRLTPKLEITKLPLVDVTPGLFAHLGHGPAGHDVAPRFNARLPTFAEYELMHQACTLRFEPFTLPTQGQRAAEVERINATRGLHLARLTEVFEQELRQRDMMGREWCEVHDREMWRRLDQWDGREPVDNVGKHWAHGGGIIGWWTPNARKWGVKSTRMIQEPSMRHANEPTYDDYATNFHLVREVVR